jgi:DNA polymerase III alpha subunit
LCLPPLINEAKKNFISYNNKLVFGFQAITSLDKKDEEIIIEREKNGKYIDIFDFFNRI